MISLNAITQGYAVPQRDFNATIHSVFSEAVNLRLGQGRQLLTLVTIDQADLPQGIRIHTPPRFSFERELHSGDRIVCHDSFLGDRRTRISVDLHQATRWKCALPDMQASGISPQVSSAWVMVWQMLNARQGRLFTEIRPSELSQANHHGQAALSKNMAMLVHELVGYVQVLDLSVEKCVSGLIGLGTGLTPSGDDFLVGYLAGLHCMAGMQGDRRAFLAKLGKIIVKHSCQTNDISRTYLYHAVRGQVSSKLLHLLEGVAAGEDTHRLNQVAEEAMQVGHSSGMEMVTGVLFGLSTWGDGLPLV